MEYKFIDNILHVQVMKDGRWYKCTISEVTDKLIEANKKVDLLRGKIEVMNL